MISEITPIHSITYASAVVHVYHAKAGEGLQKHTHTYSHATLCHAGSIIVRKEGKELVMTSTSQPLNLIAEEWHEIEAIEDGTVFCNIFTEAQL